MTDKELLNKLANIVVELNEADKALAGVRKTLADAKLTISHSRGTAHLAWCEIQGRQQMQLSEEPHPGAAVLQRQDDLDFLLGARERS